MLYHIVADSSCDLNETLASRLHLTHIPFFLTVGEETFTDDGKLNIQTLISKMKASHHSAKTACPAPGTFSEVFSQEGSHFAITISGQLSGTFGSAQVGRDFALDECGDKNIHVFDSKSASAGETLIAIKLREMIEAGLPFQQIVDRTEDFIKSMKTLFVLEDLDNLVKSGRLNKLAGYVSTALHLSPIMKGVDGSIALEEKVIGNKKALRRLADKICEINETLKHDILVIAHCNCPDKAEGLRRDVAAKGASFREIHIVPTGGLSTVYANDGGIVVAF